MSTKFFEKERLPFEKWLVSFRSYRYKNRIEPQTFIRQFDAQGYYEAYDIIRTYAERLNLEILWFKEKRNCHESYLYKHHQILESFCTYCNRKFNENEPIPCLYSDCKVIFCSKECVDNHIKIKHKKNMK